MLTITEILRLTGAGSAAPAGTAGVSGVEAVGAGLPQAAIPVSRAAVHNSAVNFLEVGYIKFVLSHSNPFSAKLPWHDAVDVYIKQLNRTNVNHVEETIISIIIVQNVYCVQ